MGLHEVAKAIVIFWLHDKLRSNLELFGKHCLEDGTSLLSVLNLSIQAFIGFHPDHTLA